MSVASETYVSSASRPRRAAAPKEPVIKRIDMRHRDALLRLASHSSLPTLRNAAEIERCVRQEVVFAAFVKDRLVGCCFIIRDVAKSYIDARGRSADFPLPNAYFCGAFVHPAHRGRGIGLRLYRHRLDYALEHYDGTIVVELLGDGTPWSVHPETKTGADFYEKNGFTTIGYSVDEDAGKIVARRIAAAGGEEWPYEVESAAPQETTVMSSPSIDLNSLLVPRGMTDLPEARRWMASLLAAKGFSPDVIGAFEQVPRHAFAEPHLVYLSYVDHYLFSGQTVLTTPSVVAQMIDVLHLDKSKKVLEIGTGTGYQTALLALVAGSVYSIERLETLADSATRAIESMGLKNVSIKSGDGYYGWADAAPFDGIIVAAAPPAVPPLLIEQLTPNGGRLVVPVGPQGGPQRLVLVERRNASIQTTDLGPTLFVPMIPETRWGAAVTSLAVPVNPWSPIRNG